MTTVPSPIRHTEQPDRTEFDELRAEITALRDGLAHEIRTERLVIVRPADGFERLTTEHIAGVFELRVHADVAGDPELECGTSAGLIANEGTTNPYAGFFVEANGNICVTLDATALPIVEGQHRHRVLLSLDDGVERADLTPQGLELKSDRAVTTDDRIELPNPIITGELTAELHAAFDELRPIITAARDAIGLVDAEVDRCGYDSPYAREVLHGLARTAELIETLDELRDFTEPGGLA